MPVSNRLSLPSDVYSLDEIARAACVPLARVKEIVARGRIATTRSLAGSSTYVAWSEAVAAVRTLKSNQPARSPVRQPPQALFSPPSGAPRSPGLPIVLSSLVHVAAVAGVAVLTTIGLTPASAQDDLLQEAPPMRLVYIAMPGPGGGGGGGGLKQRTLPPKAERNGKARLSSPLPPRKEPAPIVAVQKPPEPPPAILNAEPLPKIVAPVVAAPANDRDRAGVLEETTSAKADSRGPGEGGGVGSGTGTGLGEGDGSGIGPGSGGGTGGGPYRPGSGITPPRLLREVKPDYTEEARQHGVEGEVVLEIVVRRDGSVGDVRLLDGLHYGLNDRAIAAVRQWRFTPAQRRGVPVDVLVEAAVEFKLR